MRNVRWHIEASSGHVLEGAHDANLARNLLGYVPLDDVPDHGDRVEWFIESHLEGDHVLLSVKHGAILHHFLVMSRKKGEGLANCASSVATFGCDQFVCGILKDGDDFVFDVCERLEGVTERSFDDIVGLGNTDLLENYASLRFDMGNHHLLLHGVECDALAFAAGTCCSA